MPTTKKPAAKTEPKTQQQDLLGTTEDADKAEDQPKESSSSEEQAQEEPTSKTDAVLAAMKMQAEKRRESEERELTPEHLAKIALQRIKVARSKTDPKALQQAIALNARDLGIKPEEYREMAKGVL